MIAAPTTRPKSIYVLKYLRALVAEMGQLDHRAVNLCVYVALQEDKQRDGKPVLLTTEFLADKLRIQRRLLVELRRSIVEAGWLVYRQGRKHHPGQYQTQIPAWLCAPQDTQTDRLCAPQDTQTDTEPCLCVPQCAESATESAPQKTLCPNPKDKEGVCASKGSKKRTPKAPFAPPTVEEVRAYAADIGYAINAEAFVSSYAQKGWLVGKVPMKSWRAAVSNWKANGWGRAPVVEQVEQVHFFLPPKRNAS